MATPILEVLRAAMAPAAAARTGYLQGQDVGTQRKKAEARQVELDRRYDVEQGNKMDAEVYARGRDARADVRQTTQDQRQGLLDQSRMAVEKAQAEHARAEAGYKDRGGAPAKTGDRATARVRYIQAGTAPKLDPETNQYSSPRPAAEVAAEFDRDVWPLPPPSRGPTSARGGVPDLGAERSGPIGATGPTPGPLAQTRAALPKGPPAVASAPAKPDSASLAKKYPFLFNK